jgi:hypothetical protein
MLKSTLHGPDAGPAADGVLAAMKAVHFRWQGADVTWFDFAMGNGLGVSALLLLAIVVLWVLGGAAPEDRRALRPIAWAVFVSFVLVGALGFVYFAPGVGAAFSTIALLSGIGAVRFTRLAA